MKISSFLTILASSGRADFLDFFRESDVFAYQVRESFDKQGLGRRFQQKYDQVKKILGFYQSGGTCNSGITSPSFEPVTFDIAYNKKASPSSNIEALVARLELWIQSYACVDDSSAEAYESIQQALDEMSTIARKNTNRDQEISFHVSDEKMTYDQARAYCFLKDMWLANYESGIAKSMMSNNIDYSWLYFPNKTVCYVQQSLAGHTAWSVQQEDCNDKHHAICQAGQIATKSCLSFETSPYTTSKQKDAQNYCLSIGGNLPFFNDKKELQLWQDRPGATREWLGIVRNDTFESGWATVTGEPATIFSWYKNQPSTPSQKCATTMYGFPDKWNDVECTWADEMFRCRIDSTVYVWEDCPEIWPTTTTTTTTSTTTTTTTTTTSGSPKICVKFLDMGTDKVSYDTAIDGCRAIDGHVSFFLSDKELEFYYEHKKDRNEWLGINRSDDNKWLTLTGLESPVYDWDENEPNDLHSDENCVHSRPASNPLHKWNDRSCAPDQMFAYSCRVERTILGSEQCDDFELESPLKTCVEFRNMGTAEVDFVTAEATCVAEGGHVSFFMTEEELEAYHAVKNGRREWLGIERKNGNQWFTMTGVESTVYNWNTGEPNDAHSNENCIESYGWEKWNDVSCDLQRMFSCRIEFTVPNDQEC